MHSPEGRRKLAASGIPIVETWDLSETPIDMLVGFSHYRAGVAVAEYLCERGHQHPAIVTADDHRASQRRAGFAETLRARGVAAPPVYTVSAPTTFRHGRESLRHLLAEHPRIDAVFCSSDLMAHGLITEAQARGLTVPGDLAVVGFGDLDFAADLNPALTTVHIDGPTIGRQAAQFIIDRAAGRDPGPLIRDIGFSVVARASA
jgi:LacI family gluconate utilization system Gnt-I transcriptional repressor